MSLIINEPELAAKIKAERLASDASFRDEVWDGVYVVSPIANNEHQRIIIRLIPALQSVVDLASGDQIYAGVNVSDRDDWTTNYRVPDLAVVLRGNPLEDRDTHVLGGPDFVIEVLSPNDQAREKRPFYARIGVRELLLIDRAPWALELYRLDQDELKPAGRSTPEQPDLLLSTVLPLVFRLVRGKDRPGIEVRRSDGKQAWTA